MAAAALSPVAEQIRAAVDSGALAVDAVAGPAIGGIVAAYELGRQLGMRSFFTERDDCGSMALRRGFQVKSGEKILICEDVITTGKSLGESAKVLESLGANITAVACIVDRRPPGAEVPWPLDAAVKVDAKSWEPENCALCEKGIPAVKPGSRKTV
jgi:orotate phosphoribosyltransferase